MSISNSEFVAARALEALREKIEIVGEELEFASGIRAAAAEEVMRKHGGRGHIDADLMVDAVDELVGQERLFESYDDDCNTNPTDFMLADGMPFMSLDAYLELHEIFGENWLAIATAVYAEKWGSDALRANPDRSKELVDSARAEFARARSRTFKRFSNRTLHRTCEQAACL